MDPIMAGKLDRWITGNYGEDHPDNVDDRSDRERHEAICRAMDAERKRKARMYGLCVECGIVLSKNAYVNGMCQECGSEIDE